MAFWETISHYFHAVLSLFFFSAPSAEATPPTPPLMRELSENMVFMLQRKNTSATENKSMKHVYIACTPCTFTRMFRRFPCSVPVQRSHAAFLCSVPVQRSCAVFMCSVHVQRSRAAFPCSVRVQRSCAVFVCSFPIQRSLAAFPFSVPVQRSTDKLEYFELS